MPTFYYPPRVLAPKNTDTRQLIRGRVNNEISWGRRRRRLLLLFWSVYVCTSKDETHLRFFFWCIVAQQIENNGSAQAIRKFDKEVISGSLAPPPPPESSSNLDRAFLRLFTCLSFSNWQPWKLNFHQPQWWLLTHPSQFTWQMRRKEYRPFAGPLWFLATSLPAPPLWGTWVEMKRLRGGRYNGGNKNWKPCALIAGYKSPKNRGGGEGSMRANEGCVLIFIA